MSPSPEARYYMAEVSLRAETGTDLAWVGESLKAACRRLHGAGSSPQVLSMIHASEDDRLSCVVKASNREDVLRLFEISLLPSARVVDVVVVEAGWSEMERG